MTCPLVARWIGCARCESSTGHIRCTICRTSLLGGTSNAESVIQAQATCRRLDDSTRLLAGRLDTEHSHTQLPAVEPSGSTISPLEAGWPSGRLAVRTHSTQSSLQARLQVRPSGSTIIGPLGPITQACSVPPLTSTLTPASTPMPPSRWNLSESVGVDPREPSALVSSKACADVDVAVQVCPWPCKCDNGTDVSMHSTGQNNPLILAKNAAKH